MKKCIYRLMVLAVMVLAMCAGAFAVDEAEITINAVNFPDENFRSYVSSKFDTDNSGGLIASEIASATRIDVTNSSISSLKGVEFFTALTYLYCTRNQLTTLDVSKNTALTYLECRSNQLTTLDFQQ